MSLPFSFFWKAQRLEVWWRSSLNQQDTGVLLHSYFVGLVCAHHCVLPVLHAGAGSKHWRQWRTDSLNQWFLIFPLMIFSKCNIMVEAGELITGQNGQIHWEMSKLLVWCSHVDWNWVKSKIACSAFRQTSGEAQEIEEGGNTKSYWSRKADVREGLVLLKLISFSGCCF